MDLQRAGHLLVEDGNHGEYRPRRHEFDATGTAFIRAANMSDGQVLFDGAAKINDTALSRIRKGIGQPGDVLLSHKGTVGKVAWARHDSPSFVCSPQTTFWRAFPGGLLEPRYLLFYLQSPLFTRQLRAIEGETDMAAYVSLTNQRKMLVVVPPLPEQRRIAAVLGALDDKIELNRQMNRTLEAMATALFKSWFIDFDGHDDLVDSELGPIPRGWEVRPLAEFARLVTTSVKPFSEPARLWEHFSIPSFDDGRLPALDKGDEIKSNKYAVPEDAVLVSKLNPRFPRIWMPNVTSLQSAICSTEFMPFVPSDKSNRSFLFEYFWSSAGQHALCSRVSGTTGSRQRAKPKEIAVMPFLVPSTQQLRHFAAVAGPMNQQRLRHISESRTLAQLRDTLLPKLISGELRVPEAERQIEAAL